MKPNGLVDAPRITSHTSRPRRSQISASSLTSAMLTLRKTFSNSLASSAASGLDISVTDGATLPRIADARAVVAASVPPTRRGMLDEGRPSPGLDALRREGEAEIGPGPQPVPLEDISQRPDGRARVGRALQHHHVAATQPGADVLARRQHRTQVRLAARRHRRGDADEGDVRIGPWGVGVADPEATRVVRRLQPRRRDVVNVAVGCAQLGQPLRRCLDAQHVVARVREVERQRQADVAQPDDRDARIRQLRHAPSTCR